MQRFACSAKRAGISEGLVEAFLLHMDHPRSDSTPWIFRSKNDTCGSQLSVSQLRRLIRGHVRAPDPAQLAAKAKKAEGLMKHVYGGPGLDPRARCPEKLCRRCHVCAVFENHRSFVMGQSVLKRSKVV